MVKLQRTRRRKRVPFRSRIGRENSVVEIPAVLFGQRVRIHANTQGFVMMSLTNTQLFVKVSKRGLVYDCVMPNCIHNPLNESIEETNVTDVSLLDLVTYTSRL